MTHVDEPAPARRKRLTERWADVTLRAKITGVTVFILSLGLIVAGIGTQTFLRPQLMTALDAELRQIQVDPSIALAPSSDTTALQCFDVRGASSRYYVAILDAQGSVVCDNGELYDLSHKGAVDQDTPDVGEITSEDAYENKGSIYSLYSDDGLQWRAVVTPIVSNNGNTIAGSLLIASSTHSVNQTMARFALIFTLFSVAVLVLGAALTRILVLNTFAPLAEVEQTALEISRGDYSKRIMVSNPNTEVGHLGESLNVMLDRIDQSFEERQHTIEQMRRFISDAGHELRTPLVSVRGYAEMYRHKWLTDEEQLDHAMERIEKEAIRMGVLVDDLLALARLDERRPLEKTALSLNSIAQDAALDTHAQDPEREVRVIEDDTAPQVSGDENRVRQVMSNIIGNALRYSPEGSPLEIQVSSDRDRGVGVFEIVDHGEGVPEQMREKIFDRFWRADTSRNRETGGSGLGLSIVQSIVRAHDGSVSVHETPGGGATFRVELPLASDSA